MVQLLSGEYLSGWKNYQSRWEKKNPAKPHAQPEIPEWKGEPLQKGDKLLVISEQGLGDTIQFMRYIPYLKKQGIDVSFCAKAKLHNLIKASGIHPNPLTPEEAQIISEGKSIPLLSLPKYLGVNPQNPIINEPYIFPKDTLINKWKKNLDNENKPIIGINWQGNPNMERTYRGRSLSLETFSSLLILNDIRLLSLQKGFGSEQLEDCSFRSEFVRCQKQVDTTWDFAENAAMIKSCDLVITCDTVVAHLAGGMGQPVWLLLKDIPYWTWGMKKEKTFWYPTMKLFRQQEKDDWEEVMRRISLKLENRFNL